MTQSDFNKLQDQVDLSKRLSEADRNKGKTVDDLLAEDKAAAAALVAKMPLACQVDKAVLAAEGPETVDGKTVQTKTYETLCSNGMGYFLVSRESGAPSGISCFAADAVRKADLAAGRKPGVVCRLPELADTKALATNIMTRAGKSCAVTDYRWVGQNNTSHVEFDEVACSDKTGYMLTIALPGSTSPVVPSTCRDSAMRGLPCKLSDNGGEIITVRTFREELQKRAIVCDAGDKDVHLFGQETVQKRFVVEFRCSQRPAGLVAYLPLAGAKAPFEAIDCAAAAKRGVVCKLNAPK